MDGVQARFEEDLHIQIGRDVPINLLTWLCPVLRTFRYKYLENLPLLFIFLLKTHDYYKQNNREEVQFLLA